jgi:hypothetical protein
VRILKGHMHAPATTKRFSQLAFQANLVIARVDAC